MHEGVNGGQGSLAGIGRAARYARHRPEQALLYQIVQTHTPAFLVALAKRERVYRTTCSASSRPISRADAWSTVSCGCAVTTATPSAWSRLVASGAGSVQVVARDGWRRVRRC